MSAMKSVLPYLVSYLCFVLLSLVITGTRQWIYSAALLAGAAVVRLAAHVLDPGLEDRISRKYGSMGVEFAQRLQRARKNSS